MSRVLVTGGAGTIGATIVRRLLGDPAYEVRVSDRRPTPQWMREGCEVHTGDLRELDQARRATAGCSHVIHLAASTGADVSNAGGGGGLQRLPHTLLEVNNALHNAVIRASLELEVERFTYVSSALVFERATELPTTEAHLPDCPTPRSAAGFSELIGEVYCRAAHDEHDLQYTICRPSDPYGPGEAAAGEPGAEQPAAGEPSLDASAETSITNTVDNLIAQILSGRRPLRIPGSGEQTRTPTHVDDIADGIVTAMGSPAGRNEDFNISASRERTVEEIAQILWVSCGEDPADFELASAPAGEAAAAVPRRRLSVDKARELLGWQARIGLEDGIAATVESIRERGSIGSPA